MYLLYILEALYAHDRFTRNKIFQEKGTVLNLDDSAKVWVIQLTELSRLQGVFKETRQNI